MVWGCPRSRVPMGNCPSLVLRPSGQECFTPVLSKPERDCSERMSRRAVVGCREQPRHLVQTKAMRRQKQSGGSQLERRG